MGNRSTACSCNAQRCADELGFPQPDDRPSRDPDCDPAGTVFNETIEGLSFLDQEALRFAGTSNLAAVRWLLLMGADIRVHDSKGTTMLHAACRSGSSTLVQELVRQKASLDAVDAAGWTPLHVTAVMGRRPLALLLLRHGADPSVKNKRGATPASVCTDPGTREVFKGRILGNEPNLPDSKGGIRGDASDRTTCCVPFFVPRQALFLDSTHSAELVSLCSEMLDRSVGHGLAFCVATGVVKDRPTDLSHFLLEQRTNPKSLGEFLGEELSISETLRLAFMDSMDLFNTGVVSGLCRSFRHIHVPQNFGKIDRLTTAVAHMWWRAHDALEDLYEDEALMGSPLPAPPAGGGELSGMNLRRYMRSVEGLQRLMFSTVMLYWALHGTSGVFHVAAFSKKERISLRGWVDINSGIDIDGINVAECVLERIYTSVWEQLTTNLLPSYERSTATARPNSKAEQSVSGWAYIPPGGLERYEAVTSTGSGTPGTPHLAQCILSETSPTPMLTPRPMGMVEPVNVASATSVEAGAEAVWLSLRFSLILFLSTSPADSAPYAFLRLTDAVLRDVDRQTRQLVLAGRPRKNAGEDRDKGDNEGDLWQSPFGDIARHPLELCFLLRDGRFQSFATLWLELRFNTDEDLELWLRELGSACREAPARHREPSLAARTASTSFMVPSETGVDVDSVSRPRMPSPVSPATQPRQPSDRDGSVQPHLPRIERTPPPTPPNLRGPGELKGDEKPVPDELMPICENSEVSQMNIMGPPAQEPEENLPSTAEFHSPVAPTMRIMTNYV